MKKEIVKRKGYTLIELSIGIAIVSVLLIAIFVLAPKLMTSSKAGNTVAAFSGITAAMEQVKVNNGGAYPAQAAAAAVSANAALLTELGGTAGTRDLTGWTYQCPVGAGQTATISIPALESAEVRDSAMNKINGRYAPWVAIANGANAITVTKANITCY